MNTSSIQLTIPFYKGSERSEEQTLLSRNLRITSFAIGIILISVGTLALTGHFNKIFNVTYGWTFTSFGIASSCLGTFVRCPKKNEVIFSERITHNLEMNLKRALQTKPIEKNTLQDPSLGVTPPPPESQVNSTNLQAVSVSSTHSLNQLSNRIRSLKTQGSTGNILGIYVTTNESSLNETLSILSKKDRISNGCHIGFSGWHNFDIMSVCESAYGIICDYNPRNAEFINEIVKNLKISPKRTIFVKNILPYIKDIEGFCAKNFNSSTDDISEEVKDELNRDGSWLSSDTRFEHIRSLALSDKIVAITENILSTETFVTISRLLKENNFSIDTVYISNIAGYISEKDRSKFINTVTSIIEDETFVINCPSIEHTDWKQKSNLLFNNPGPQQHVCRGKSLIENPSMYFKIKL